jgi:aspartyl-tRNA(Asn)/glutamyl-tRNA(Gln) amidotransferase subunit C
MALSKETVEYVANLSRIELRPDELDKISGQLESILGFIDKLSALDIRNTEPTSHILPVSNILREDAVKESLPIEKTLANAPQKDGKFFVVPKVVEQGGEIGTV